MKTGPERCKNDSLVAVRKVFDIFVENGMQPIIQITILLLMNNRMDLEEHIRLGYIYIYEIQSS